MALFGPGGRRLLIAPAPEAAERLRKVDLLGVLGEVGLAASLLAAQIEQRRMAALDIVEPVPASLDVT